MAQASLNHWTALIAPTEAALSCLGTKKLHPETASKTSQQYKVTLMCMQARDTYCLEYVQEAVHIALYKVSV